MNGGLSRYSLTRLRAENAVKTLGPKQFVARLPWLWKPGDDFSGFVRRVPPQRLLSQLQMFSRRMDPSEAAEKVLSCDSILFTESFSHDLHRLGEQLGLELEEFHERSFGDPLTPTKKELEPLRERLEPEYRMIEQVREALGAGREEALSRAR